MSKHQLNCGSCLFLNRERCFERRCSDLGKLPTNKSCNSYKPDMFTLVGSGQKIDRMQKMATAVHGMSANELQALGAVLHAERNTRKAGWRFMQKVYVRYTGSSNRNYLSNFLVGYVLYADKEYVRIVGDSGKMFLSVLNDSEGNTLFTVKAFKALRDQMLAGRKFSDPEGSPDYMRSHVAKLDEIAASDQPLRKQVTKKKSKEDDLVSIVSRMARGIIGRNTGSKPKKEVKEGAEITFR